MTSCTSREKCSVNESKCILPSKAKCKKLECKCVTNDCIRSSQTVIQKSRPIIVSRTIVVGLGLGPFPFQAICPACGANVITKTCSFPSRTTYVSCLALACILCCLICWLPFFCKPCKKVVHKCPKCNYSIGVYDLCEKNS